MSVRAYFILRDDNNLKIPHYLLSTTGPYLFRSEAERFARVITAATGYRCCLSVIEIERMLGEVVRFNGRWLITNVWDIRATDNGFLGEVIVNGKLYMVQRSPEDPWQAVDQAQNNTRPV